MRFWRVRTIHLGPSGKHGIVSTLLEILDMETKLKQIVKNMFQPFLRFWTVAYNKLPYRGCCEVSTLLEILEKLHLVKRHVDALKRFQPFLRFWRGKEKGVAQELSLSFNPS